MTADEYNSLCRATGFNRKKVKRHKYVAYRAKSKLKGELQMREILFRGKSIDNAKWLEGDLLRYADTTQIWVDGEYGKDNYTVIPQTVGQYTGLTDKNGKKIFEGDIVKQTFETTIEEKGEDDTYIYGYDIGEVILISSRGACIKNPYQHREIDGDIAKEYEKTKMCKNIVSYRCEVIGNIYDNSELLEAGLNG